MKTIIISDLHLTPRFNKEKFLKIKEVFDSADRIIINGDLWDGYLTTFDKFLNSRWKDLFSVMKSKNAIYIYGNHDTKDLADDRVNIFCDHYSHEYIFTEAGTTYIVRHGNEIKDFHEENLPKIVKRFGTLFNRYTSEVLVRIFGVLGYGKEFWDKNSLFKTWAKQNLRNGDILICSHTHYPEVDLESKIANTGYVLHGWCTYLVLEDGKLRLEQEKW